MHEEVPGPHHRAKFHHRGYRNVGLSPVKSTKYGILCYKSASKKSIPLSNFFFTKFGMQREWDFKICTLMPNFTLWL